MVGLAGMRSDGPMHLEQSLQTRLLLNMPWEEVLGSQESRGRARRYDAPPNCVQCRVLRQRFAEPRRPSSRTCRPVGPPGSHASWERDHPRLARGGRVKVLVIFIECRFRYSLGQNYRFSWSTISSLRIPEVCPQHLPRPMQV